LLVIRNIGNKNLQQPATTHATQFLPFRMNEFAFRHEKYIYMFAAAAVRVVNDKREGESSSLWETTD